MTKGKQLLCCITLSVLTYEYRFPDAYFLHNTEAMVKTFQLKRDYKLPSFSVSSLFVFLLKAKFYSLKLWETLKEAELTTLSSKSLYFLRVFKWNQQKTQLKLA